MCCAVELTNVFCMCYSKRHLIQYVDQDQSNSQSLRVLQKHLTQLAQPHTQ